MARTPADGGPFRFEYDPSVIRFGEGSARELDAELARHDLERALVVTGATVGTTDAVIEPVSEGLGDRLGDVLASTTPKKRLDTAVEAAERFEEIDADVLVGLGGGSSLDVAKAAAVVVASDLTPAELGTELAENGTLPATPDVPPVVAVPTTLAGADLSMGGGITASADNGLVEESTGGGVGHPALMPIAVVADPELFATTPRGVLAASAMNGFDKGIESIVGGAATPITDGTAVRGLRLLVESLPALGDESIDAETMNPIVRGILLVQYGISRPDGSTLSIVHAFGHGLSAAGAHQGTAHGVVVPHILRFVFESVDGRRDLLADALGVGDADDPASAVVEAVAGVRDAMGLPDRLRDVDGAPEPDEFERVVDTIVADRLMNNLPPGLEADREDVEEILETAW